MMNNDSVHKHHTRPFNSPLEYGLRTLFILDASKNISMDLRRLIAYDYLLVHSSDIEDGPKSLHPAVPYRGTELLVKRDMVQAGLNHMVAKELVQVSFAPNGFLYGPTELTVAFISLLKSSYAAELKIRARWVCDHFKIYSDRDLETYINRNISEWGGEFEMLTAVDQLEL